MDWILVVDDEEDICAILKYNLENNGFKVVTAHSAEEALGLDLSSCRLVLLDVMMGEMSGFDMAERLKSNPDTASLPIIFVTAKDTEDDTVAGLNLGADDYISKPFSVREVVSRVRAVLRRTAVRSTRIAYETLEMDTESKTVSVDGESVYLTKTEFGILRLLLENRGRVYSREDILAKVWPDEVLVLGRTVDVNITRLRKKIGRYGDNIVTRHGYGYIFTK